VRLAGSKVEPLPVQMATRSAQSSQSWRRLWRLGTLVEDAGLSGRQMQQCPSTSGSARSRDRRGGRLRQTTRRPRSPARSEAPRHRDPWPTRPGSRGRGDATKVAGSVRRGWTRRTETAPGSPSTAASTSTTSAARLMSTASSGPGWLP
jgi:hypothetical protein